MPAQESNLESLVYETSVLTIEAQEFVWLDRPGPGGHIFQLPLVFTDGKAVKINTRRIRFFSPYLQVHIVTFSSWIFYIM